MRKFKKEILAITFGVAFAYFWQLLFLLMCYASNPGGDFITWNMFIPIDTIQIAMAPFVAWVLMGMFKVTWKEKWFHITMCGLAFTIPFVIISVITVFIAPSLWREKMYWIANIMISMILTFTVFKSFLIVKYSDMESLPKESEKC